MGIRAAGDNRMVELASEIRDYCRAHANPKLVQKYARYFREGYDAWGLLDRNHPLWRTKRPEWLERYRDAGLPGFLRLGELLFSSGKYEEGALAIQFLKEWRGQFQAKHLRGLSRWFNAGVNNWAHTDVLCSEVLTPLLTSGTLSLDDFASWRESNLKYQRRAVPVAMLGVLKSTTETQELLSFIRPMMLDAERVVQQGLGWFLREAWKKNPEPVEAFLMEWKDRSPRLIFQYATEKMTPAARGRFRKTRA